MRIIVPYGTAAPNAVPQAGGNAVLVQSGPPGPAGVAGTSGDYGFISYSEAAGAQPVLIPAGVRTKMTFAPDPAATLDHLRGLFAGHAFWDGQQVLPRAVGDDAEIRLNTRITSFVIGGSVLADIDIGGAFGVIESDNRVLTFPAGSPETVRFLFVEYFLNTYLANGGSIYLTPSVPISVTNESLVFYPRGAGP